MAMKKSISIVLTIILCLTTFAFAEKQLEKSEILEILAVLTANPQKVWIQSGTIEATHEEYRASTTTDANKINSRIAEEVQAYKDNPNKIQLTEKLQQMKLEAIPFNTRYKLANEYTMNSTVIVKVDGEKFYWEINVGSRADSVKKPADLVDNFLTDEFNLTCNTKRVFAWDGQSYVTYSRPINHATIEPGRFPVNGSLTAGVVPWGHGRYSLEELTKAGSSATEIGTEIHLTVERADRQESFVLDSEKSYALSQFTSVRQNGKTKVYNYGGYQSINGKWYPAIVLIEEFDTSDVPQKLLARDVWNFTSIDLTKPAENAFAVAYEYDAFIEDFCFDDDKPLQYRHSAPEIPDISRVDTDELKIKRLEFASSGGKQNCATASLKYVCDKLGAKCSLENLSKIVHGNKNTSPLAEMQQFAQNLGLNAVAVKTDIETLAGVDSYQVIVYLPEQKHFVVLETVDNEFVRLIDLGSNAFYYRRSIDWFKSAWDGTALLISTEPVRLAGSFVKLNNTNLENIIGCCGCQSCTKLLQLYYIITCYQDGCICAGTYEIHYTRYGCEDAPSGTCSESSMVRYKETQCGMAPYCECALSGDWTFYYMQACS